MNGPKMTATSVCQDMGTASDMIDPAAGICNCTSENSYKFLQERGASTSDYFLSPPVLGV